MKRISPITVDAQLSISIRDNEVVIELEDEDAVTQPVRIIIPGERFLQALGRLSNVSCTASFVALDTIGKKRELKDFEFEVPKNLSSCNEKDLTTVIDIGNKQCPEGWEMSTYFRSQTSFRFEGDKQIAKTHIMRWVDK